MADFFSRIFAIPSDVSSTYSYDDDDDDDDDLRRERRGTNNRKARGHARSLTPLSLTDGNNTTASSFGGTLSQASDSLMMERSHDESTNNSVEIEEWSHLHSNNNNDDNEKYNTRHASKNSSSSRGRRQRRNDVSVRSSSEPRSPNKKTQRSSSMVASPTQQQQRRTNNSKHNMTLQLSSPTKKSTSGGSSRRHRSLSKMGNRNDYDVHESDDNNYEKDDDISPRRRHRSTSQHKRSSSSHNNTRSSSTQHKSSRSKSQQQRMNSNEYSSSNNTNTTKDNNNKSKPKKDKSNKKEKKKWFTKHWSPGTTSEQGGTPPKTKSKKDGSTKKSAAVSSPRSSSKNYNKKKRSGHPHNGGEDGKLRLLPPGQQQRQQPINVGDSIIISQQFLEDNMEMSVLTMPRELKSFDTSSVVLLEEGEEDNDKSTSCLDADEIIRMAERDVHEVAGLSSKQTHHTHTHIQQEMGLGQSHTVSMEYDKARVYPNIGAYASRILENSSYRQDQQQSSGTKHGNKQPCGDPPHEMNGDNPLMTMPPPPPPPTPPPLSRGSRRSPAASSTQSSQQQKSSATAHWNTPGSNNLESQSVVSCDPPGTLVTSPTLQASTDIHDDKLSLTHHRQDEPQKQDPPGDEYSPFDEDSSGLDGMSSSMAKPMGVDASPQQEQQPTSSHHRLRSNKAVTFSLPSATPLPAPPFMGPSLDYYYSMERNTNTPLPCWSNSPLLPPIIELWSSVESSTNSEIGDKWDIRQENELLGEETPLIISEKWIDVQDKEWDKAVVEMATTNKATEAATATPSTNRIKTSHFLDEDMMAEDEYFDDILNCGEDSSTNVGGVFDNSPSRQSENVPLDDGDVNSRHRSTWNTTYKPPTATSSFYFPEQDNLYDNDNWKRLVRARANAATIIQKSTRGILGRERMRSLMKSTLIIQTCIRRFLARKRFLDYKKVKRSYYPKRWEKSQNGEERGHNHNRERSMANISVLNLTFD